MYSDENQGYTTQRYIHINACVFLIQFIPSEVKGISVSWLQEYKNNIPLLNIEVLLTDLYIQPVERSSR